MLNLLKNESAYRAAQEEVDRIVGRAPVRVEHLKKLAYLDAVLRESLRLAPTAPSMTKKVNPEFKGKATLGKGKYAIEPTDRIVALFGVTQRDPKVYGNDANEFKPERMLGENFKKLPQAAWKVNGTMSTLFSYQVQAVLMLESLLGAAFEPASGVHSHGRKLSWYYPCSCRTSTSSSMILPIRCASSRR